MYTFLPHTHFHSNPFISSLIVYMYGRGIQIKKTSPNIDKHIDAQTHTCTNSHTQTHTHTHTHTHRVCSVHSMKHLEVNQS